MDDLKEIEKPIGDFVLENAKGTTGADGLYYHYSDVCKLLKLYHENIISKQAPVAIIMQQGAWVETKQCPNTKAQI